MTDSAGVVIPARYGSNRFPGKPLAEIHGEPMIRWVARHADQADEVDSVYVATDDERIGEAVESLGVQVAMPEGPFSSGSDRVAAVARELDHEIVVNLQGDEPTFSPEALDQGIERMRSDPEAVLGSYMAPCDREQAEDPDVVCVVTDDQDRALYFSRSPIPYPRKEPDHWWQHVGVYLFRRQYLVEYAQSEPSSLEETESLEQLRVLQSGDAISMVRLSAPTAGVDRAEDIPKAERQLPLADDDLTE